MKMSIPRLHRLLGYVLLLPFIAWALTGVIFLTKPGYEAAYERLQVRTYPLSSEFTAAAAADWLEFRVLKTVLGEHLLVKKDTAWQQVDLQTLAERPLVSPQEIALLLEDAFLANPGRYGQLLEIDGNKAETDTGVNIELNWAEMTLSQKGRDTRWIKRFYKIHYIQWSGHAQLDRVLGILALLTLIVMTYLGFRMSFGPSKGRET